MNNLEKTDADEKNTKYNKYTGKKNKPENPELLKKLMGKKKEIYESKREPNLVSRKELVALIKDKTGYPQYEIFQILDGMVEVIGELINKDIPVLISNFIKIYIKKIDKRNMWIGLENKFREVEKSKRLVIKASPTFKQKYIVREDIDVDVDET